MANNERIPDPLSHVTDLKLSLAALEAEKKRIEARYDRRIADLRLAIHEIEQSGSRLSGVSSSQPSQRAGSEDRSLAPYHPTPESVVTKMLELGRLKRGERLFDLGSGDARIVTAAARRFGAEATGVELDEQLWQQSASAIKRLRLNKRARVVLGDLLDQDVSSADLVTLYLVPSGNERVREMLERQLRSGARVVSHDYEMPSWTAETVERVEDGGDGRSHALFVYTR